MKQKVRTVKLANKSGYLLLLSLLISGHFWSLNASNKPSEAWMTIFIHGILPVQAHVSIPNFIRFLKDNVENTTYAKTVEYMRNDNFFFQNQAMQESGLVQVDVTTIKRGYTSGALAFLFDEMNTILKPNQRNFYYTFGWSGLLSHKKRLEDAQDLYMNLSAELDALKKRNINPKIRIVAYSHGGNVALNLAAIVENKQKFTINQLVLLGMPVQNETDYLINHPIFKHIYHVYSRGDRVQRLDISSSGRFFSGKKFSARSGFKLPDKLVQIQLRVIKRKGKIEQKLPFDETNKRLLTGTAGYLRDISPGHIELWSFGWSPKRYRKEFPYYPLPMVALFPFIIHETQTYKTNPDKPIVVDIRPDYQVMILRNKNKPHDSRIIEFIPKQVISRLKLAMDPYIPENYTKREFRKHVAIAYQKAKQWKKDSKNSDK